MYMKGVFAEIAPVAAPISSTYKVLIMISSTQNRCFRYTFIPKSRDPVDQKVMGSTQGFELREFQPFLPDTIHTELKKSADSEQKNTELRLRQWFGHNTAHISFIQMHSSSHCCKAQFVDLLHVYLYNICQNTQTILRKSTQLGECLQKGLGHGGECHYDKIAVTQNSTMTKDAIVPQEK